MTILFLPPAPHTGAFFDTVRNRLSDLDTRAATYPGYGNVPKTHISIPAYAESVLANAKGATLVGFHTGCLVAIEAALQNKDIGPLILVDVPYFDAATKEKYAAGLDADNPAHDAFRAAFAYNADDAFKRLSHKVMCVATESNLFEPTVKASGKIKNSVLIERPDITKPAFESETMANLIHDMTQINRNA